MFIIKDDNKYGYKPVYVTYVLMVACADYRKAVRYGYTDTLREFSNCR